MNGLLAAQARVADVKGTLAARWHCCARAFTHLASWSRSKAEYEREGPALCNLRPELLHSCPAMMPESSLCPKPARAGSAWGEVRKTPEQHIFLTTSAGADQSPLRSGHVNTPEGS
ncbi:unnamed protein product [Symbiodinium natans]|uniref:Uncharacterized protein n=1 Tax=Symbiodinium natans TaxID=878477 RepID=A0A812SLL6_9DINO|nr:unnamed protein product [Symbiodinium natans]